jgi:hypothetical protein
MLVFQILQVVPDVLLPPTFTTKVLGMRDYHHHLLIPLELFLALLHLLDFSRQFLSSNLVSAADG